MQMSSPTVLVCSRPLVILAVCVCMCIGDGNLRLMGKTHMSAGPDGLKDPQELNVEQRI